MHARAEGGPGVGVRAGSDDMEGDPFVFVAAISVAQERRFPNWARRNVSPGRGGESGRQGSKVSHIGCTMSAPGAEELPKGGGCPHWDDENQ